jgi:methionyl-tRNA formyltransferase
MNAGQLHDLLAIKGADLITQALEDIRDDEAKPFPQENAEVTHAPKLFTTHCVLDFSKKASDLHNQVRGLSPYPTAYTIMKEKKIKVFESKYEQDSLIDIPMGDYKTDHRSYLKIACADGWLYFLDVQLEGKKRMDIGSFLRGANWI